MDMDEERKYLYWLCHVSGLGSVKIKKLYESTGSYKKLFNMEGEKLEKVGLLKGKERLSFDETKRKIDEFQNELMAMENRGIYYFTSLDQQYPKRLLEIYGYPMGLFVRGKFPEEGKPTAAIIGARSCTNYGRQVATYLGRELSKAGIQIISGLASGIDGAGHEGALKAGEDTFGILGCGINICYPKENYGLFESMSRQGGVITEFLPGENPKPSNFPMRNRIISGLSDVILVIEAREKSGSLITANLGLEQGKEIFALPGRITDPLSTGCNKLIGEGANVLLGTDSVLEYFQLHFGQGQSENQSMKDRISDAEQKVYQCLDIEPKSLEEIVNLCQIPIGDCINILLELEFRGCIVQTYHHYYGKKL